MMIALKERIGIDNVESFCMLILSFIAILKKDVPDSEWLAFVMSKES